MPQIDSRWDGTVAANALEQSRVRRGAWAIASSMLPTVRSGFLQRLVGHETPGDLTGLAAAFLAAVPDLDVDTVQVFADAIVDGSIDPEGLQSLDPEQLDRLAAATVDKAAELARQTTQALELLESGESAVEEQLLNRLQPIIEQAVSRAEGNARLQADYLRLLPHPIETAPAPPASSQESGVYDALIADLARHGATVDVASGQVTVTLADRDDTQNNVKCLAILDRRLSQAGADTQPALKTLAASYASALADSGDAQRLTRDLFERGPLMRVALGLTPTTRELVVRAAIDSGLEVMSAWSEIPDPRGMAKRPHHQRVGTDLGARGSDRPCTTRIRKPRSRPLSHPTGATRPARERHKARLRPGCTPCPPRPRANDRRLRAAVATFTRLGVSAVSPLGTLLSRREIDPERHDHRSPGTRRDVHVPVDRQIAIDGIPVVKAHLERHGA